MPHSDFSLEPNAWEGGEQMLVVAGGGVLSWPSWGGGAIPPRGQHGIQAGLGGSPSVCAGAGPRAPRLQDQGNPFGKQRPVSFCLPEVGGGVCLGLWAEEESPWEPGKTAGDSRRQGSLAWTVSSEADWQKGKDSEPRSRTGTRACGWALLVNKVEVVLRCGGACTLLCQRWSRGTRKGGARG